MLFRQQFLALIAKTMEQIPLFCRKWILGLSYKLICLGSTAIFFVSPELECFPLHSVIPCVRILIDRIKNRNYHNYCCCCCFTLCEFFILVLIGGLSVKCEWQQVLSISWNLLSILADFGSAIVWIASLLWTLLSILMNLTVLWFVWYRFFFWFPVLPVSFPSPWEPFREY